MLITTCGILISIVSFIFWYLLGILSLPKNYIISTKFPVFPAFVGAAIFTFICWHGIENSIPLQTLFKGIGFLFVVLLAIRIKHFSLMMKYYFIIKEKKLRYKWLFWVGAYIVFYVSIALFLPIPDTQYYLPFNILGNLDIFNYIDITQYFISPHSTDLANLSYLDVSWGLYYQTPAAYYFFAWMSVFYDNNAMMASMPTLYSAAAAIGLMITYYCHRFFRCSYLISFTIALVILCGSFYRYIIGLYYLPSLMGTIVWLAFLVEILQWRFSLLQRSSFFHLAVVIIIYESLLFLLYPVFLLFNGVIFFILCNMMLFLNKEFFSWYDWIKKNIFFIGCLLISSAIVTILFPGYLKMVISNLNEFSHRVGVSGLFLISPAVILGFPSLFESIVETQFMLLAAFVLTTGGFLYSIHATQLKMLPAARVLFYLAIGAFISYFIYYFIEGPERYQPWKFASYFILPLAATFWAVAFNLLKHLGGSKKIFIGVMLFCLVGNFLWVKMLTVHPSTKDYVYLSQLNKIPEKNLYVKMSHSVSTFLAVFYIREKHLYLLRPSYYPQISLRALSENSPFFLESSKGCEFSVPSKKRMRIHNIGCLYYGMPMLRFEKNYDFSENLPFMEAKGLSEVFFAPIRKARKSEGREMWLRFYLNKNELLKHPKGYINIEVKPFLNTQMRNQKVRIEWGPKQQKFFSLNSRKWIRLPYNKNDWQLSGSPLSPSLRQITIHFHLLNAKKPFMYNFHNKDPYANALKFIQFSIASQSTSLEP